MSFELSKLWVTRKRSDSANTKWIFYSFYIGLERKMVPIETEPLSWAVFEITGLKDIWITTLTFEGHVTSSMTSSFDPP